MCVAMCVHAYGAHANEVHAYGFHDFAEHSSRVRQIILSSPERAAVMIHVIDEETKRAKWLPRLPRESVATALCLPEATIPMIFLSFHT